MTQVWKRQNPDKCRNQLNCILKCGNVMEHKTQKKKQQQQYQQQHTNTHTHTQMQGDGSHTDAQLVRCRQHK